MAELSFILTGFGIVVAVLALLWLVCVLIGRAHRPKSNEKAPTAPAAPSTAEAAIPGAHLAAISAAITTMLPGRHRIVRVYAPGHKSAAWIEEGRFELSHSHRIRWDWAITGPIDPPHHEKN